LATQKFSVSAAGRVHILDGDLSGGGHRFGSGKNRTEFPSSWPDDEIIQAIEEVANDPTSAEQPTGSPGRVKRAGVRNGVLIVVVVDLGTGQIATGYPRKF
jgi:hypothetical protein